MARQRRKFRSCSFESLEDRRLLAGDVSASIVQGDLVIEGDSQDNGISITAGATPGTVVVTGINVGGSATNLNGTANGSVTLSGFTDDLKIKMKGGNDAVTITGLTVPDDADIDGGDGNDTFTLSNVTINDSLDMDLDKDDDTATLTNVTVSDEAEIEGSRGADNVTITNSIFDELEVEIGRDNDNLNISGTTVHDETELDGGKGTNILRTGSGNSLGDVDIDDFTVVNDTAPTVDLNTVSPITENNSATLTGSFTDADLTDTHTLIVDWADSNNSTDSTFAVPAVSGLSVNQTINSSTDSAVLTITAVNTTTGQVTYSVQHRYADDGVSPGNAAASDIAAILVTVRDSLSATGSDTTTVTVNNAVPVVALNTVTAITENNTATLIGNFTDIGLSDVHTMTVNWGDPNVSALSTFAVPITSSLATNQTINSSTDSAVLRITAVNTATGQVSYSVQHRYADDGVSPGNSTASDTRTITVTVADDDTGSGTNTTTVTVNNQTPTVALNAVSAVAENGVATLTGSYTDIGLSDAHTLTVNWGDANSSTNSTFAVPATSGLTVNQTINSSTGDGAVLTITAINTGTGQASFSVQHRYLDDGLAPGNTTTSDTSTITVTVSDDDTGTDSETATVVVSNVAPQISDPANTSLNENGEVSLTATITDVGTRDVFSVEVNWQDGAADTITGLGLVNISETTQGGTKYTWTAATRQLTVKHTYLDDDPTATASDVKAVTLTPRDDDGGTGATQTINVTVNNVAPQISDPADIPVNENGEVTLTATITDPGTKDVFSVDVNWQDGSPDTITGLGLSDVASTTVGGTTFTWTAATRQLTVKHTYPDDNPTATASDIKAVTLTPHDDDLGIGTTQTVNVTVNNVSPSLMLLSPTPIVVNGTATLTGSFTDIGVSDTHVLVVDWGDSSNDSTFAIAATSGLLAAQTFGSSTDSATLTIVSVNTTTGEVTFSVQHQYTAADTYSITSTLDDDDLGTDTDSVSITVDNPVM